MATIDLAGGGAAALPTQTGRVNAIRLSKVVDLAKVAEKKGSDLASGDVINVFSVPAGSYVLLGVTEVEEAETNASALTVDVGLGGGDTITDGADATSAGFKAGGSNGSRELRTTSAFQTSDTTVDVTLASATGTPANGKIRVAVLMLDANGV